MKPARRQGRRSDLAYLSLWLIFSSLLVLQARAATYYVIVAGLGGEPDYEQRFTSAAKDLEKIAKGSNINAQTQMLIGQDANAIHLKDVLANISRSATPEDDFILILIGHGSFDGTVYKFNLVGPDISAEELAEMCNSIHTRRQLIVDTSSASGGAIPALRRSGRAVIAATKSGTEKNATVFARYWIEALQDPSADTDKNGSVSAMEAFIYATNKTAGFYSTQKRLATEHAVFTDSPNAEPVREVSTGQGALLTSMTLVQFGSAEQSVNSPSKIALLTKKAKLEQQIDVLKFQKAAIDSVDYKRRLTILLLDLAHIQQELNR